MNDYFGRFSRTFTDEVRATIGRIDELIGEAHWPSVGNYKEGVIRRQLVDYLPSRYSVGTGFVLFPEDTAPVRSRQIDVLIWDSHNYAPLFRDGSFVIIPPQALRVAIEVKSTLTPDSMWESLANLDSLTQFIDVLTAYHTADPEARTGFQRFVVAAGTSMKFPDDVFRHLHRYYLRCVYDKDNPTEQPVQASVQRRIALTKQSFLWGMTPWISGIAALGAGMVRATRMGDSQVGYFVSNDVEADQQDQTIGIIRASIDLFLTSDVLRKGQRDYTRMGREIRGQVMPVPYSKELPEKTRNTLFDLGDEPLTWTLDDAIRAKAKRDERKRRRQEITELDEGEAE